MFKETYTPIKDLEKLCSQSGHTSHVVAMFICTLILGVMLGYGWRMYHEIKEPVIVKYEPIAIDTTKGLYIPPDYKNRYNK